MMVKQYPHHWLLSTPDGNFVHGRCKQCEAKRDFPARLDETERGNDYQEISRAPRYEMASWKKRLAPAGAKNGRLLFQATRRA